MSFITHVLASYLTTISSLLKTLTTVATLYLLILLLFPLTQNYIRARRTGLRVIISPITPYNLTWRIASSSLRPILQHCTWYRVIDWTCCWQDASLASTSAEKEVLVVSPGLILLCTRDEKTIEGVLRKWREFEKPEWVNDILGTFGRNVDTSNGDDWTRHRKIIAPCFNERASARVWIEALAQTDRLVKSWLDSKSGAIVEGMSTLALNVISAVAFENHNVNEPTAGHTMSLKEALTTVMSTYISPMVEGFMHNPLVRICLPPRIRRLLRAMSEFSQYMDDLVTRERAQSQKHSAAPRNLIQTLIHANAAVDQAGKPQLSDSELRGNVFLFTIGGLESTSATLTYALALLAVNPEVQEWVYEEIDGLTDLSDDYGKVFPRLGRVRAVMFETLRLFAPSPPLPRTYYNPSLPCDIPTSTGSGILTLPPKTQIILNSWPVHHIYSSLSPATSPPSTEWNPKLWLSNAAPEKFFPWGFGPRVCPGMKFSQVEFCAVLVGVFGRVRIKAGREEVQRVLAGSVADPLLLHVREEIRVSVEERD
ncbi:hypothetical protein HBI24_161690 [Parastagonospora nodorum]|nr:hypothetical protein HBH51_241390 [Parastagonospora nodorum]KAH3997135.1 hypothetical protein HBI10_149420 [Parastagonospora nodorum]KAH4020129.1 hypothetical protein HBI13_122540 [Parastagonospora nodorum]KAH4215129.1 hypothetical protein HBI95_017610 [Parastagonospora nodorum]KAH4311559.1 hypothetical protein HBI01_016410 [Parastagonospora nodorum]